MTAQDLQKVFNRLEELRAEMIDAWTCKTHIKTMNETIDFIKSDFNQVFGMEIFIND